MYKRALVFIMALTAHYSIFSQMAGQAPITAGNGGAQGGSQNLIAYVAGDITNKKNKALDVTNYQGSPYTSNDFQQSTLFNGEEKVSTIFYRYNAYNGEVEVKGNQQDETIASLSKDKSLYILENGRPLSFKTFIDKNKVTTNGYLSTLVADGTYTLYQRINVKYTPGSPAANSFVKAIPNRFSHFTEYYYQKDGVNRIDEFKNTNSGLLKILSSDVKAKMKNHLNEAQLNIKEESDLIKAFEFLNSLN